MDLRVGLGVVGAALGMTQNDMAGTGIPQHGGGNIAGMRARSIGVTILAPDQQGGGGGSRHAGDQRCGGPEQHHADRVGVGGKQGGNFGQMGRPSVLFPIAGGEFALVVPQISICGIMAWIGATREGVRGRGRL